MSDKKISQLPASTTPLAGTEVLAVVQSGDTKKVSVANLTSGRVVDASEVTVTDNTPQIRLIDADAAGNPYARLYVNGAIFSIDADWGDSSNNTIMRFTVDGDTKATLQDDLTVSAGNLVIGTSGKGIDFSADGSAAGMTSELLDDYEEGTWTPTLTTSSVDFTSVTYDGFTGGRYVKVGNKVTVYGTLRTDAVSIGSASGAVSIGNLPFVAADNTGSTRDGASAAAISDTTGWAVNHPSTGQTLGGTALLLLYYRATVNGAASVLTATDVATGANANRIAFCATYLTA